MKKKKNKKTKQELMFPQQLQREDIFPSPIWYGDEPGFVNELNNASDKYIEAANIGAPFSSTTFPLMLVFT